jgi:hypothetical protein
VQLLSGSIATFLMALLSSLAALVSYGVLGRVKLVRTTSGVYQTVRSTGISPGKAGKTGLEPNFAENVPFRTGPTGPVREEKREK